MRYRRQGYHNDGKNPAPREMPSYDFRDGQIQSLRCTPPVMKDDHIKERCFEFVLLLPLSEMAHRRLIYFFYWMHPHRTLNVILSLSFCLVCISVVTAAFTTFF